MKEELLGIADAKIDKEGERPKQSFCAIATSGEFWKPFACVGVLFIIFRLSCFSILSHFTAPFLDRAGIELDPLLVGAIIGVVRLIFSLMSILILSFISKRTAFILGGLATTFGILLGKS